MIFKTKVTAHKRTLVVITLFMLLSSSIIADAGGDLDALLFDTVLSVSSSRNSSNMEDKIKNIENLLKSGANPNILHGMTNGYEISLSSQTLTGLYIPGKASPLMIANSIEVVNLLINYGADINFQDNYGRTPLMIYTYFFSLGESRYENIFSLLIERGADINIRDNLGRTALYYALFWTRLSVVKILIENGAFVNNEDNNRITPLQIICFGKPSTLVAWWLDPDDIEIIRLFEAAGGVKVFNDIEIERMWDGRDYFFHYRLEVSYVDR
jgi:hypothetical protein